MIICPKHFSFKAHFLKLRQLSSLPDPVKLSFTKFKPFKSEKKQLNPVLIYHGLFGSKQNWRSLSANISNATGRVVYAIDLRNHGTSDFSQEFNYKAMVSDLLKLMEDELLNQIVLIGHSLGGRVAYQFAFTFVSFIAI